MSGSVWSGLLTSVTSDGDVCVLGVSGELDFGGAEVLERGLFEASLCVGSGGRVIVDLSDCRAAKPEFLSRGLKRITARSSSGTPVVLVADGSLYRLLEASHPDHGLHVYSCVADAVGSHRKSLRVV